MSTTADTAQATGIPGAASEFEGILARQDNEEAPEQAAAEAPEGANEPEIPEQETPAEEQSEEGSEGEEGSANEEGTEEAAPSPALVAVTVDGKTEHLPIEEVAKGYQRQADYTRKTMAHAEEVKAFQADRQQVVGERAQYAQLLTALQAQLQQPEPDWQALHDANPVEYLRQKDIWRDKQERAAAAQFELQRTQSLQAQEQQANLRKIRDEGLRKLPELIPEWKDAKKWEADRVALLDYGKQIGFTPEELSQTYDPRAVVALHKARLYDKLMANKPKPVVNNGPRVLPAGSTNTAPKAANAGSRAKERLAKSGRVADAASFFEATME